VKQELSPPNVFLVGAWQLLVFGRIGNLSDNVLCYSEKSQRVLLPDFLLDPDG
jgi:hypothetical protein